MFLAGGLFLCAKTGVCLDVRTVEQSGKKLVEFENGLCRIVLAPDLARLPLTFFFKTTGHDLLVGPDSKPFTESLSVPNTSERHVYYGGLIDCLPWASGKTDGRMDRKRFPVKGYLAISPWTYSIGESLNSAWYLGETGFDYDDPATNRRTTLSFRKKLTAYAGSTQLRMDYSIRNAGRSQARFMFDAHSRTAVAGYDAGDYFYAPGKRCYVYELANMPEVEGRGISAGTWTDWPVPEAMNFTPRKDRGHIFVYLPAEWCTVGDEKHKENLFYVSSPVRIGNKTDTLKMGIFMTNAAYVD